MQPADNRMSFSLVLILVYMGLMGSCGDLGVRNFQGMEAPLRSDSLRILFLGNSITPYDETGDWQQKSGLAASTPDSDYVHILMRRITEKQGAEPNTQTKRISVFERAFVDYDLDDLAAYRDFEANLIVVRIGDNVDEALAVRNHFWKYYLRLLEFFEESETQPLFICTSSWYTTPTVDAIMRSVCQDKNITFVDISMLLSDMTNHASSEREIADPGIGSHPGDKGMREIADLIWGAIDRLLAPDS